VSKDDDSENLVGEREDANQEGLKLVSLKVVCQGFSLGHAVHH
jgi:hypothetical protein